jgi:Cu/Ag efflux pump CusA
VQRPLATAVIAGIGLWTLLTLLVFPGILRFALGGWEPANAREPLELSQGG